MDLWGDGLAKTKQECSSQALSWISQKDGEVFHVNRETTQDLMGMGKRKKT
nr:hypothetical protein [Pseudomonas syringae]